MFRVYNRGLFTLNHVINLISLCQIVGINTDLSLTAPVASTSAFDPETLKPSPSDAPPAAAHDRDNKRCAIM